MLCKWIHQKRWLVIVLAALSLSGCSPRNTTIGQSKSTTPLSPQEEALRKRFKGVYGGELRVDATFRTNRSVVLDPENGLGFHGIAGSYAPGGASISSYGNSGDGDRVAIPERLRLLRWADEAKFVSHHPTTHYEGNPIVDIIVPVAERIPDDILQAARQKRGSLRLKIRIHPETLLIGWDLAIRIGKYEMAGGDFKEAYIYGGKVIEKGWYIDPKTNERVETDY